MFFVYRVCADVDYFYRIMAKDVNGTTNHGPRRCYVDRALKDVSVSHGL